MKALTGRQLHEIAYSKLSMYSHNVQRRAVGVSHEVHRQLAALNASSALFDKQDEQMVLALAGTTIWLSILRHNGEPNH